jgi:hypothetical protein
MHDANENKDDGMVRRTKRRKRAVVLELHYNVVTVVL